jgi:hypothetical protein
MADVYVAFVREDQGFAEALAIALHGSGFAVSRSTSVVDAITECPAIIVLWSAAASRSRLFLDAAERAQQAGKMILALLSQDPVPASFAGVETCSLTRWLGDPEDPEIDPVVFQVDRLVSRARLAPGGRAAASQQTAPPRGVVHQFPAQAAGMRGSAARAQAATQPEAVPNAYNNQTVPAQQAPAADPLAEEAAYWRRIQNSNDSADFEGYLARYGERGTFAELAVDRIRKLRAGRPVPQQQAAPPQQQKAAAFQRGGFPINTPPPHRQAAEPSRAEPHPARTRPRMEMPPAEPNQGGGFGRTLLVLILVGALAGAGWWAYSRRSAPAPGAENQVEDWTPPPPPAGMDNRIEAGVSLDESALPSPKVELPGSRKQEEQQARPATETRPPSFAETLTPAPTLRKIEPGAAVAAPGGPVISPGAPPPAAIDPREAEAMARDLTPQAPAPAAAPAAPVALAKPIWTRLPTAAQRSGLYPAIARDRGKAGSAQLSCVIMPDLGLTCSVASETPQGMGFGAAGLRVAQFYRAGPTLTDGKPSPGERVTLPIRFNSDQE